MEKKNKLIQFSTTWCGPCKRAKKFIEDTYDPSIDLYEFVDTDADDYPYKAVAEKVRVRSVPRFVVYNEEDKKIVADFIGLDMIRLKQFFENGDDEK
jgi:thiol-disulfide isomerase/thioredoxin